MTAMEELSKKLGELPEGRVLAGFSGGADSTALMFLLAAARDNGRIQPEAVHVNHGLRGAESDGDEAFCAGFCRELGIPLHIERAGLDGRTDENACREERFRCFRKVMEEAYEKPEEMHLKPLTTVIRRPDEVKAARKPVVRYDYPGSV